MRKNYNCFDYCPNNTNRYDDDAISKRHSEATDGKSVTRGCSSNTWRSALNLTSATIMTAHTLFVSLLHCQSFSAQSEMYATLYDVGIQHPSNGNHTTATGYSNLSLKISLKK